MAEALGVSRQNLTDWLRGGHVPSYDKAVALEAFLAKQQRRRARR